MKNLSFYEQVGIVVPGSVLLFGLLLMQPDLRDVIAKDGVTLGGLGIFVLLSYATGHLVAALANVLESILWWPFGGMPSSWVINAKRPFLTNKQTALLESRLGTRLGLGEIKVHGMDRSAWNKTFQQLYRDVLGTKPGRSEVFNGNYGLNRGLAAATLTLAFVLPFFVPNHLLASAALLGIWVRSVFLIGAYRFGVHFAREVVTRFLLLPADPTTNFGKSLEKSGRIKKLFECNGASPPPVRRAQGLSGEIAGNEACSFTARGPAALKKSMGVQTEAK